MSDQTAFQQRLQDLRRQLETLDVRIRELGTDPHTGMIDYDRTPEVAALTQERDRISDTIRQSRPAPIFQPLNGIVQIGAHGQRHDFDKTGVFPPDRNGRTQIVIQGDGKPVYLNLSQEAALTLARRINAACGQ